MSRRRRRRRGNNKSGNNRGNNQQSRNRSRDRGGSGGSNRGAGNGQASRDQRPDTPGFWGDPSKLPDAPEGIKVTDDPHAVPRSLGEPPLPQKREIAGHYFEAIYERAIQTAGALAAAGGLVDYADLARTSDDDQS